MFLMYTGYAKWLLFPIENSIDPDLKNVTDKFFNAIPVIYNKIAY